MFTQHISIITLWFLQNVNDMLRISHIATVVAKVTNSVYAIEGYSVDTIL